MTIKEQIDQLRQAFKEQYGVKVEIAVKVHKSNNPFSPEDAFSNVKMVASEFGVKMPEKKKASPETLEKMPEMHALRWYEVTAPGVAYTVFFTEPQA